MPLRLTPVALEGEQHAWALFDHDTTTTWTPGIEPVEVLFAAPERIHELRVFAASAARVKLESDDGWTRTVELAGAQGWVTLPLDEPRELSSVRVSAVDAADAGAIAEVELWSRRPLTFGALRESHLRARYERPLEEAAIPHQLDVVDARPSFSVLGGDEGGSRCAVFSLDLPRPAAAYRRVLVAYRTQGVFRPFALSRAVNDVTSRQGVVLVEGGEPSLTLEPLDPDTLAHGANTIRFCLPSDASEPAVLQRVRVFAELDDGQVLLDEDERLPALTTVTEEEGLYLPFTRLVEPRRVVLTEASTMAWALSCFDANGDPREVPARALVGAPGTIAFEPEGAASCEALALQPRSPMASVGSVTVFGSPAQRPTDWPRVLVTSPHEHFGRVAWVEGWVDDVTGAPWLVQLTVNGEPVPTVAGGFATLIERADDASPDWPVVLTATFPDGEIVVRRVTLSLTEAIEWSGWDPGTGSSEENAAVAEEAASYGPEGGSVSQTATPDDGGEIWLGSKVGVSVPPGAVSATTDITVIHIGADLLPRLEPGMVNVTAPRAHAYEMLPHGQRFATPIEVVLPFDAALIPAGQSAEDVHTFYYEPRAKEWRKLQRARVDEESGVVRSLTDHFTLMINATVVAPEHPELASFNPTQIKDIQAANPAAGIRLIEPPTANPMGDARLSYPLDVPPGRLGMQPDLALTYSSSGGNGWLGLGWDLSIPSITVDTRWGVPRYLEGKESESYLFAGEQLTPQPHRLDELPDRTSERVFHPRVEGGIVDLVRHGTGPTSYTWEVTDKRGRKLFFGGLDRVDPAAVLTDEVVDKDAPEDPARQNDGNIFHWALTRIQDTNGNTVDFRYERVVDKGTGGADDDAFAPVVGHELFLTEIRYTGHDGVPGPYAVTLEREGARRPDVIIDARGGFKRVVATRLARVAVALDGEQIRAWELEYRDGVFGKSLLATVRQLGPNDEPFPGNVHSFDYFDEVPRSVNDNGDVVFGGFDAAALTSSFDDGAGPFSGLLPDEVAPTVLDGSESLTGGGSLSVSVGVSPTKDLSIGNTFTFSTGDSRGVVTLTDIDGDRLPDKVFQRGNQFFYRKNVTRSGEVAFSNELLPVRFDVVGAPIFTPSFYRSQSGTVSANLHVSVSDTFGSIGATAGIGLSLATGTSYLTDVNADGLVDLVHHGLVLFGRVTGNGVRFFPSSMGTFVPLGDSAVCADRVLTDDGELLSGLLGDMTLGIPIPPEAAGVMEFLGFPADEVTDLGDDLLELSDGVASTGRPIDTVRRWVAPFMGTVSIGGEYVLAPDEETPCSRADGVRIAVQHNHKELWAKTVLPGEPADEPRHVDAVSVRKGDRIYFRVGSILDGTCDQLSWAPVIRYSGGPAPDSNGLDAKRYSAKEDFVLGGQRDAGLAVERSGHIVIDGELSASAPLSDDVRIIIEKESVLFDELLDDLLDDVPIEVLPVTRESIGDTDRSDLDEAVSVSFSFPVNVNAGDRIIARIEANSPVNVAALNVELVATYISVEGEGELEDPLPTVDLPYDVDIYSRSSLSRPQAGWTVPERKDGTSVTIRAEVDSDPGDFVMPHDDLVFTVKSGGRKVAARKVMAYAGNVHTFDFTISPEEGDELFFEISSRDPDAFEAGLMAAVTASYTVTRDGEDEEVTEDVPSAVFGRRAKGVFAEPYRGWSTAGYAAGGSRGTDSLEESDFDVIDEEVDPRDAGVFPFSPARDRGDSRWRGPTPQSWVSALGVSSGRTGGVLQLNAPSGAGVCLAPPRMSTTAQVTASGSLVAAGGGMAFGATTSNVDYLDLNGDSFPDIVGMGHVQFTSAQGGLLEQPVASPVTFPIRAALSGAMSVSGGFGIREPEISPSSAGRTDSSGRGALREGRSGARTDATSVIIANGGVDVGMSESVTDLVDMNGDGLPDRVSLLDVWGALADLAPLLDLAEVSIGEIETPLDLFNEVTEAFLLTVALNLGNGSFGAPEAWGGGLLNSGHNGSAGLTGGFNATVGLFGGGVSASLTTRASGTHMTLLDINGDGLMDLVGPGDQAAFQVWFNTGASLAEDVGWGWQTDSDNDPGPVLEVARDVSSSADGTVFGHVTAPLICGEVPCGFLHLSSSVSAGASAGRQEVAVRDIDGDGYPDHLFSTKEEELVVSRNRIGRTNLLRRVHRPLGSEVEVDYVRTGNTLEQPASRWVLSRVQVFDGVDHDWPEGASPDRVGTDHLLTTFAYENGLYHRFEREFLGFARVTETQHDTTGIDPSDLTSAPAYRRVVRDFGRFKGDPRCNAGEEDMLRFLCGRFWYGKGLLVHEEVQDLNAPSPRLLSTTEHSYVFRDVDNGGALGDPTSATARLLPALEHTKRRIFEGTSTPVESVTTAEYDVHGNVVRSVDEGEPGSDNDDVIAVARYTSELTDCKARGIVSMPTSILVTDSAGRVLAERHARFNCVTGNMAELEEHDEEGVARSSFGYESNGNLDSVTGPANLNGERYRLDFEYDDVTHTHVTSVRDSFGYESGEAYDLRFGAPTSSTDVNGNVITSEYDDFGRLRRVIGPYEAGVYAYTLEFDYHPTPGDEPVDGFVPFAVTKHMNTLGDPGDPIETVLFVDGLGRVVQTKKDATIHVGEDQAPQDEMIVSGRVVFDHVGRVKAQYYPTTEAKGSTNTELSSGFDTEPPPTRTAYDALDRATRVTLPDGTTTRMAYTLVDDDGHRRLSTLVEDTNGNQRQTFRDVRGLVTAVRELDGALPIVTRYEHDPLQRLARIIDAQGNVTRIEYDELGRRTAIENPDTGRVTFEWDLAGNLVKKVTPTLRAAGQASLYGYRYGRLEHITYPSHPDDNVTYEYGGPELAGQPGNRAGRLTRVTDRSGSEERLYGRLGEVIEERRTINHTSGDPVTYTTTYQFDTWGRLATMTYPDGEVLTYTYDSGGLVSSVRGQKEGFDYPYLVRIEHDEYEQRAFTETGTGIKTRYDYDPIDRRLEQLRAGDFQKLVYSYDAVGNITGLVNDAPPSGRFGGHTEQSFGYDSLYRLTSATGRFQTHNEHVHDYELSLGYDDIHNIRQKEQVHRRTTPGGTIGVQHGTTYTHNYQYNSAQPHAPSRIGTRQYGYDLNGNQLGWLDTSSNQRRTIQWDAENRIRSIDDNGRETRFVYDDAGERVLKVGHGETAYVNQHFTVRNRTQLTKHVWVGTSRMVSKLVPGDEEEEDGSEDEEPLPCDPLHVHGNGHPAGHRHGQGHEPYHCHGEEEGTEEPPPEEEEPPPCALEGEPAEKDFVYYYHPDHLGTTSFVTDCRGQVYRHTAYFPFGETWVDQASETNRVPYLFTGKELDEETGLYYFGARYYDPRTQLWVSTDPLYLLQGPVALNVYHYAALNPVGYSDPDGRCTPTPRGLDCLAYPRSLDAQAAQAMDDALEREAYGEAVLAATLRFANLANYAFGFAGQTFVQPGNASYKTTSGVMEGDLQKTVDGAVETAFIFGTAGLMKAPSPRAATGQPGGVSGAVAVPQITAASNREMAAQAIKHTQRLDGTAAQKADLFEQLAGQIARLSGGSWAAVRGAGTEGSHIFVGKAGEALVVSPAGQLFRGSLSSGVKPVGNGRFSVDYSLMRSIE